MTSSRIHRLLFCGLLVGLLAQGPAGAASLEATPHALRSGLTDSIKDSLIAPDRLELAATSASLELAEDALSDGLPSALLKKSSSLKTVVKSGAQIAGDTTGIAKLIPVAGTMSVADYLARELGSKFHRRASWAGQNGYQPITSRVRTWGPIGTVRALTIHHSEGIPDEHPAAMIRHIYRGHTAPGGHLNAADIGYHFLVDRNGHVWEGRHATKIGTHVGSTPIGLNNTGNLGICGLGTFHNEAPPKAMVDGIVNLSALLSQYYGKPLGVRGHQDWVGIHQFHPRGGCDCPGRLAGAVRIARSTIARAFSVTETQMTATLRSGEGSRVARATPPTTRTSRPTARKTAKK